MKASDDSFYGVSVKAVITDPADGNKLLVVKEHTANWALPGGGMKHGETVLDALARELHEELYVSEIASADFLGSFSYYASSKQLWRLWLLYKVTINDYDVLKATDTTDAQYIALDNLKVSDSLPERRIYASLQYVEYLSL